MGEESPKPARTPTGAVFLSYASEDTEAAERIATALRAAGIEVWFDKSELRGGDAWDRQIRQQIHDCRLFIPVVSTHTEVRIEGYFRREWKLAVDRTHDRSERVAFLVPVVIDWTSEQKADVPDAFRHVQWTRLLSGETSPAFVERVQRLLSPSERMPPGSRPAPETLPVTPPTTKVSSNAKQTSLTAVAIAFSVVLAYFVADKFWLSRRERPSAVSTTLGVPSQSSAVPEKSIAVLPFVDMSEKKDQEYFSDGLSEELIDMLTKITDLRVSARTSSFYFKGRPEKIPTIAHELGVAHILEGSVRRSGDRLRVTAQLVRADSGYSLWSDTFDREAKSIFQVQDEIAGAVVTALRMKLAPAQQTISSGRTDNLEAYNRYLLGKQLYPRNSEQSVRHAVTAFQEAITLEPSYAVAYAGLAVAQSRLLDYDYSQAANQEAIAHAEKAVALGPQLPETYAARGLLRLLNLDISGAAADSDKALTLNPNDGDILRLHGELLATSGKLTEAVVVMRRALEVDPLHVELHEDLGRYLAALGKYREAHDVLSRGVEINGEAEYIHYALGTTELLQGRASDAVANFGREPLGPLRYAGLAMAEHSAGHSAESLKTVEELSTTYGQFWTYLVADVFAWRGETGKALDWLERAFQAHDNGLRQIKYDPLLTQIRPDPRYKTLLHKLNLPE
jgi:TolB-like protein/Tfp pilus assembly protein PilF